MKYKLGDRVRIVSETPEGLNWNDEMDKYLGKVMTIKSIVGGLIFCGSYIMAEDKGNWFWYDTMIAGLASEVPFDFGAWKGKKVCMHCKTEEEAEDFCKVMDAAGLRWINGNSYLLNRKSYRLLNTPEGLYYFFNKGTFSDRIPDKNKFHVLEWSDYRSTEPKKEQEKTMETKIDDEPLSFAEAMKIRKRLCTSMRDVCKNCPLSSDNNDTTESCDDFMLDHPDMAELILKEWMAEHPLKTNKDKFAEVFGEIERFGKCEIIDCSTVPCLECGWWNREYVEPNKE